ncbi:CarD family transcriptional regulator, partial [Streptomyces albidoflavus]|uniref:CarD family transcriptional regulator n=1 Tax=Streptomyces albidoflavus TaxID=1886 RepID=UPI003F4D2FDC
MEVVRLGGSGAGGRCSRCGAGGPCGAGAGAGGAAGPGCGGAGAGAGAGAAGRGWAGAWPQPPPPPPPGGVAGPWPPEASMTVSIFQLTWNSSPSACFSTSSLPLLAKLSRAPALRKPSWSVVPSNPATWAFWLSRIQVKRRRFLTASRTFGHRARASTAPGGGVAGAHEQHGVGRYIEMVQRTVQGATREYLLVEYAP